MPLSGGFKRISLLIGSSIFALLAAEIVLRFYLFTIPKDVWGLKSPWLYTRGMGDTDYWYYRYLWCDKTFLEKKSLQSDADPKEDFYARWAESLEFDPLLGYKRKPNVVFPGHETSNLGTRGKRQYSLGGEKIVFYGDSFVESNAPSESTLTAKMENQSGLDCLNYGVGGYGLDQIYLLFEQTYKQFDLSQAHFLIGVFGEDLQRMLLKARQSAKPYFTVDGPVPTLHTEHIDAEHPKRYFEQYKPHFRLFIGELLIKKIKPLDDWSIARNQRLEDAKIKRLAAILVEKFKRSSAKVIFVIFSDWRGDILRQELNERQMPIINVDLFIKGYIARAGVPAPTLFPAGHPSQALNEAIAGFILEKLKVHKISSRKI